MSHNASARLMYLLMQTPADDRVGRSSIPIDGPDFEMPAGPSTLPAVRTWSAPKDPARTREHRTPAGDVASAKRIADVNAKLQAIDETVVIGASVASSEAIRRFVTAGRAVFTLQGASSRYTFKVTRKDPTDRFPGVKYFVALLTGPDNTSDYTYVGVLDVQTGTVRPTGKSSYREESTPVKAFNWFMARIWRGVAIPEPARFYHVGRCGRCGRALTVPSSIETGLGPECAGKLGE
jgi:hypothetical protein